MRLSSRCLLPLLLVLALVAAACGDDDGETSTDQDPVVSEDETPDEPETPSEDPEEDPDEPETAPDDQGEDPEPEDVTLTASARGMTEDTIHIGLAIADVTAFSNTGDQTARFQAVADVINDGGGIIGRRLELHFAEWDLLDASGYDAACVELTGDIEVFAIVTRVPANFGEMTCFTVLNDHITVNALDVDESEVKASDGKLFSILSDRFSALLGGVEALAPELAGSRISIAASSSGDGESQAAQLEARLTELGLDVVETTLGTISYTDDSEAALAEQNRFSERWQVAGTTHVIAIGNAAVGAATALADTGAGDKITLITPLIGVRSLNALGADLSQLDMIGVAAPDFANVAEQGINGMPECISIIEDAGAGPVILRPEEEELTALPSTAGACAAFDFLRAVLEATGPNPTQDDVLALTGPGFAFDMTSAGSASVSAVKAYMNDDAGIIYSWDAENLLFEVRS